MPDPEKPEVNGALVEGLSIGIKTAVTIGVSIVAAAVFVGSVTISLKLEMKDNTNAVVRVADRVDEIAKAIDGYSDLQAEVKILRADVTRLESEFQRVNSGK